MLFVNHYNSSRMSSSNICELHNNWTRANMQEKQIKSVIKRKTPLDLNLPHGAPNLILESREKNSVQAWHEFTTCVRWWKWWLQVSCREEIL